MTSSKKEKVTRRWTENRWFPYHSYEMHGDLWTIARLYLVESHRGHVSSFIDELRPVSGPRMLDLIQETLNDCF